MDDLRAVMDAAGSQRAFLFGISESGPMAALFAPSRADDEAFVRSWGRFERRAVSKGAMRKIVALAVDTDVRHVLGAIRVPTLVLHRSGDCPVPVEAGRYLAAAIPGARFVEVAGAGHFPWVGETEAILGEVEPALRASPAT